MVDASRMSAFEDKITAALRSEPAAWTPACPEPESFLDWIEQGDSYPGAPMLLDHISSCAYCRREYVAMREAWEQARRPGVHTASQFSTAHTVRDLPDKVAAWVEQLLQEGFTAPVRAVREALDRIDRAVARAAPVPVRGTQGPTDLRPAFTAIRSLSPRLTWTAADRAEGYLVTVYQSQERKKPRQIWSDNVGNQTQFILPTQVELEPGRVYVWQVIAVEGDQEHPSAPVGFAIVTEQIRSTVGALEQEVGDAPLALASLYEAYGLYEEALQQIENGNRLDVNFDMQCTLQAKLQERLHGPLR